MISDSKLEAVIDKVIEYADLSHLTGRGGEVPDISLWPRDAEKCKAELRKILEGK